MCCVLCIGIWGRSTVYRRTSKRFQGYGRMELSIVLILPILRLYSGPSLSFLSIFLFFVFYSCEYKHAKSRNMVETFITVRAQRLPGSKHRGKEEESLCHWVPAPQKRKRGTPLRPFSFPPLVRIIHTHQYIGSSTIITGLLLQLSSIDTSLSSSISGGYGSFFSCVRKFYSLTEVDVSPGAWVCFCCAAAVFASPRTTLSFSGRNLALCLTFSRFFYFGSHIRKFEFRRDKFYEK